VTLAPLGLLIEPEAENLITESDMTKWMRSRVTVTSTLSLFGDPVYFMKGNGAFLQHSILLPYPMVRTPTLRTMSIYMKNADIRFAQIAIGSDLNIHANFDLQLGVLGTKHANAQSSIVPAGDGWYRCSMTTTSALGILFILYLTTAANAIRAQGNQTSGAIFICFPQMELGSVATSYIPTSGSSVTRAADVILSDVSMSIFRLYGVRDFVGPVGRRGLLGVDGQPGLPGAP
jgi:hypothetical protein